MWNDRRFTDLVGVKHPIVQAPMAGSCTPALAAAVSGAGGLGSLGVGPRPLAFIRERCAEFRALSDGPLNLNFFAHSEASADPSLLERSLNGLEKVYAKLGATPPENVSLSAVPGFDEAKLQLVLTLGPEVVTFHFGIPSAQAIHAMQSAGIIVGATATTVAEAKAIEAAGFDFLVAQGFEAGGHRGAHKETRPDGGIGTLALIPQIVDSVSIPVVAAGGIADGRGIAAALILGASGAQLGTAFLLCPEAATDPARRKKIAGAQDTDTIVTSVVSGRANRVAVSSWAKNIHATCAPHLPYPLQYEITGPLIDGPTDEFAAHQYGQAAALTRDLPAHELMTLLVSETEEVFSKSAMRRD